MKTSNNVFNNNISIYLCIHFFLNFVSHVTVRFLKYHCAFIYNYWDSKYIFQLAFLKTLLYYNMRCFEEYIG